MMRHAAYVRPGPPFVLPDACPGGVLIHGYAVPTGRLLFVTPVTTGSVDTTAKNNAAAAADLEPGETGVCLVAYDGEDGERLEWEEVS